MSLHIKSPGEKPGVYPIAQRGAHLKYLSFTIVELGGNLKEHVFDSGEEEVCLDFYTGPVRVAVAPPEPVLYKLCRPGWAVIVERIPNAQGTRFVCPFCPKSHRVPGPVRGFKKVRRAQWSRLRRVEE